MVVSWSIGAVCGAVCNMRHPTTLIRACEKFCSGSVVDACEDMVVSKCTSGYVSHSGDEAHANGMLRRCVRISRYCFVVEPTESGSVGFSCH